MNKLTINILGKDEPSDDKKTAALPSRKLRKLGRRRVGGIRFWDLGYLANGTNLPFVDPHSGDDILGPGAFPTFDTLTLSYYDQIQSLIFATSQNDWKTTYKQVDSAYENYGSTFGSPITVRYKGTSYSFANSAVWNGDRLLPNGAVTDNSFEVVINTKISHRIRLGLSSPNKVTATLDYSAASVAFTPSKSMDVFIVPALIDATLSNINDYIVGFRSNLDALDKLRFVYPRELFHNPAVDIYGEFLDTYLWSRISGPDTLAAYEEVFAVTKYWRDSFGGQRARRAKNTTSGFTLEALAVGDYAPLSLFPEPPSMPVPVPSPGVAGTAQLEALFAVNFPLTGALVAVIKKSGTYYYIWQD